MNNKGLATTIMSVMIMTLLSCFYGCQCVYDDLSHCVSNKLVFSYLGDGTKEVLPDHINSIDVYVYNADKSKLVKQVRIDDFKGMKRPSIDLNLPKGNYHVVAIGNVHDKTQVNNGSDLNGVRIGEPNVFDPQAKKLKGNDRLYLTDKVITSNPGGPIKEDLLRFASAHIRMHFQVTNVPDSYNDVDYPFVIRMKPVGGTIDKSGRVTPSDSKPLDLEPTWGEYGGERVLQGGVNTLRFDNDTEMVMQLMTPSGQVLMEASLKQFMKDYKITVNDRNEVDIYVRFYFRGLMVRVAPWVAVDTTPVTE